MASTRRRSGRNVKYKVTQSLYLNVHLKNKTIFKSVYDLFLSLIDLR